MLCCLQQPKMFERCVIAKCYYGSDGLGRERQQKSSPDNIVIAYVRTGIHKFLQISRNRIQILYSRRVMWSKFPTEDSQLWNDVWTLLWSALSSHCVWTDNTFLYIRINCHNYAENRSHRKKYSRPVIRHPRFLHLWLRRLQTLLKG